MTRRMATPAPVRLPVASQRRPMARPAADPGRSAFDPPSLTSCAFYAFAAVVLLVCLGAFLVLVL